MKFTAVTKVTIKLNPQEINQLVGEINRLFNAAAGRNFNIPMLEALRTDLEPFRTNLGV